MVLEGSRSSLTASDLETEIDSENEFYERGSDFGLNSQLSVTLFLNSRSYRCYSKLLTPSFIDNFSFGRDDFDSRSREDEFWSEAHGS
jgi:hypothetical protein